MAQDSSKIKKRFMWGVILGLLLIIGGLAVVLGIFLVKAPDPQVTLAPTEIATGPQRGNRAPDFTLQDMNGQTVSLSDYRGRPVLVNFWATWCPPCIREMPALQEAQVYFAETGFTVLAVNASYSEERSLNVIHYVTSEGFTFPILMDTDAAVADLYYIDSYPVSWFIDGDGIIQRIQFGAMERDVMFNLIAEFVD